MKKTFLIPLFCVAALFGTSCYSEYGSVHAKRSSVVGAVVGAGAGALIGEHNDRELEGAAIGGVLGALTGSVLGSARDEEYYGQRPSQPRYRSYNDAPPYRSYGGSYYGGNSGYYSSGHHHHSNSYYSRPRYRSSSYGSGSYCR